MLGAGHLGDRRFQLRDRVVESPLSTLKHTLSGHRPPASSIRFSNDGRTLFSASGDWQVKIWDLDAYQERFTLNGHTKGVNCMAISSDGTVIASGARDATIRLWRAPLR